VTEHDDERAAIGSQELESSLDQQRADALPLPFRCHSQRRKTHPGDAPPDMPFAIIDDHGCKQDVADDRAAILRDKRQEWNARLAQPIDDVGLLRPRECQLVDAADPSDIFSSFDADDRHEHIVPRRRFAVLANDASNSRSAHRSPALGGLW
jgi:hypothetical protein